MQLSYKPLDLKSIRLYPHQGTMYPSVTSVLGILSDPPYIAQWKSKVGEREAERTINTARARGKYIHAMAEHYFNGNLRQAPLTERELMMLMSDCKTNSDEVEFYSGDCVVPDAIPVDEKIKKFAVAFNTYIATHGANITETYVCEVPLINTEIGVAGTPDWIGRADGQTTLDDYKTSATARLSNEMKDRYFMQLCVYAAMWNLKNPDKMIQRVRLIPFTNARKGGLGEIEEIVIENMFAEERGMRYYYDKFLECFEAFKHLLLNHPGYAECAFRLQHTMSVGTEEG